jgi:glycosyltransferase 2 family protein
MDWRWAVLALVASALTYVGAALNLTTAVQLGGSFINRITPVKVGGMAVNVRYLEKQGIDAATTVGGVGIAVLVGGVMHIALTAVFLVWAGSKARVVKLPSSSAILLVLVGVAAAVGLALLVRPARRLLRTLVIPQVRKAAGELREALRDPARLSLSFLARTAVAAAARRRVGAAPWRRP